MKSGALESKYLKLIKVKYIAELVPMLRKISISELLLHDIVVRISKDDTEREIDGQSATLLDQT